MDNPNALSPVEREKELPWQSISNAPENVVVETKIDDANGCRNESTLQRIGRLWYVPDGSWYVYYTPTHWRPLPKRSLWDKLTRRGVSHA